MYIIFQIIWVFISICGSFTLFLQAILKKSQKQHFTELIRDAWTKFDNTNSLEVAWVLIKVQQLVYDRVLGAKIISKKAFLRTSIISNALLATSLLINGYFLGTQIGPPPWEIYETSLNSKVLEAKFKDRSNPAFNSPKSHALIEWLLKHKSTKWKVIYSIWFIIVVIILNSLLDSASIITARQIIRELLEAGGPWTLTAVLFLNLFIALFLSIITISSFIVLTEPIMWAATVSAPLPVGIVIAYASSTLLGWIFFFLAPSLKAAVIVSVLPSLILGALSVISIFPYSLRKQLHTVGNIFLERAAQYESGDLSFITLVLGSVGLLLSSINILIKLL
jgi:hypothetical protein